jgi:hypothetical protein
MACGRSAGWDLWPASAPAGRAAPSGGRRRSRASRRDAGRPGSRGPGSRRRPGRRRPSGRAAGPGRGRSHTRGRCAAGTRRAGCRLTLAADHADVLQVAHGAGDRGRAGPEQLGEPGGRQAARVGDQQGGEHPGGHGGTPASTRTAANRSMNGPTACSLRSTDCCVVIVRCPFAPAGRPGSRPGSFAGPLPSRAPAAAVPGPAGRVARFVLNFHDFLNLVYGMNHDCGNRSGRPGQELRPDARAGRARPDRGHGEVHGFLGPNGPARRRPADPARPAARRRRYRAPARR